MELNFKTFGEGQPLLILHGLFGSSDNWLTLGRKLAEQYKVYLIDQRNHGRSPWSNDWNYQLMAEDLLEFVQTHQLDNFILVGHSMGGKTAMNYAARYYPSKIQKLIVVDIAPKSYPIHHDKIVAGLRSLDLNQINSRKDADVQLANYVEEVGVRQFLLKNLYRNDEKRFDWRINLQVIGDNLDNMSVGLPDNFEFDGPTLFIRGLRSKYIKDGDEAVIQHHFPNASIQDVAQAGHWVHAEKPQEFLEILLSFIQS
ncbi:alpha/beta hydrolase [marine bacterium AO1-C]|nr:alpha/beta hydrolase [marine bacterium AO1-C]